MKKGAVLFSLLFWLCLCSVHIYSKTRPIQFEIHYDSQTKQTYTIKKEMQETFDDLVSGLHAESQKVMLSHNIEKFSTEKVKAEWKEKLILIEGDGKGSVIEGELVQREYCMEKVQPRSLLQELFSH